MGGSGKNPNSMILKDKIAVTLGSIRTLLSGGGSEKNQVHDVWNSVLRSSSGESFIAFVMNNYLFFEFVK